MHWQGTEEAQIPLSCTQPVGQDVREFPLSLLDWSDQARPGMVARHHILQNKQRTYYRAVQVV